MNERKEILGRIGAMLDALDLPDLEGIAEGLALIVYHRVENPSANDRPTLRRLRAERDHAAATAAPGVN